VLDEADEMLNMGFKEDVEKILESTDNERRQTVRFFFFFVHLSYRTTQTTTAERRAEKQCWL